MEYKSIDTIGFLSLIFSAASVVGVVALTLGPWGADPSGQTVRTILIIGQVAFWMVGLLASNVGKILRAQADQIAALQRQLAGRQSCG